MMIIMIIILITNFVVSVVDKQLLFDWCEKTCSSLGITITNFGSSWVGLYKSYTKTHNYKTHFELIFFTTTTNNNNNNYNTYKTGGHFVVLCPVYDPIFFQRKKLSP